MAPARRARQHRKLCQFAVSQRVGHVPLREVPVAGRKSKGRLIKVCVTVDRSQNRPLWLDGYVCCGADVMSGFQEEEEVVAAY